MNIVVLAFVVLVVVVVVVVGVVVVFVVVGSSSAIKVKLWEQGQLWFLKGLGFLGSFLGFLLGRFLRI